jgi:uncharacterized damage-inducible protein DinB
MNPRIAPVAQILAGNAALFQLGVDGVNAELALDRPAGRANHIGFIASHVLGARAYLVSFLGGDGSHALSDDIEGSIDELDPPPMAAAAEAFDQLTARLDERLRTLTDEELDRAVEESFPFADSTVIGILTFLAWHEAYHVGQLGLMRSYLGLGSLTGR